MRTAIVTGAAHGIGKAITERLASDGYRVVVIDPDGAQLTANIAQWDAAGLDIVGHELDCRDRKGVAAALDAEGSIDLAVNNAGISGTITPIEQLTREACAQNISVNLLGSFRVAQEAARRMSAGGRIINIASRAYLGAGEIAHYGAAKAGVVAMTRAMAMELRWKGITVNAIAPGLIDTRAIGFFGDQLDMLKAMEVSGEPASPTVIADMVSFLAGPGAAFVSGQTFLVEGGKTLGFPPL